MRTLPIPVDLPRIAAFCQNHGVIELSIFGSVLGDNFRAGSDVDVLVQFEPGRTLTLDTYAEMCEELSLQFGREIDLVELRRLADPYRRHEILRTREVIYGG